MSNQIPQLAHRVLRVVYDLQFRGRTMAILSRPVKGGPRECVPAGADHMPIRFESVPILVLLAEFYEPGLDYMAHPVTDLRAAIRYCDRQGWIEPFWVEGGEAEVHAGFIREVEAAVPGYFRPDGALVESFWTHQDVEHIPPIYGAENPKQFREDLKMDDMRHCHLSGITVDGFPLYWVFRRLHKCPMGPDLDGPAKRMTLGYPAQLSGYPPDENYVITKAGIAFVESDITVKGGQAETSGVAEGGAEITLTEASRQHDVPMVEESRATAHKAAEAPAGERPSNVPKQVSPARSHSDSVPESVTRPPKPGVSQNFTVAALCEMTGLENTTLNRYAKLAKVTTPRRGQRNFRYSETAARAILKTIIANTNEDRLLARCQIALRNLQEITE